MMTQLYESVAAGLKEITACEVFLEAAPQESVPPYFLVSINKQEAARGMNGRATNKISLDVMYFPENTEDGKAKQECWSMGHELGMNFSVPGFPVRNRKSEIIDKVLHHTFEIALRTIPEAEETQMQQLTKTTNLKED